MSVCVCLCRSSFDSSAALSKRKAQTEGEDTEEDVEEQKVSVIALVSIQVVSQYGLKKPSVLLYVVKLNQFLPVFTFVN